ncbi:Crp/Fnr family transcriptional regulator [Pedobacter sp. ISL-68]|uniref:Crp/Fnr family transcriptional regulator n=1 Tax=unclassified Pedobacter TaxID=2628915 RepID=UPI001BE52D20|nr:MULTISPECIES: Crp/Fnr family transcriptional regulator [unclassified Pedobacter]MBT2560928.1 Crp/Fnr family transcriptional regulator [Pedobacter sp. ISL-64]MBT2590318.1 Crp/Fnr family transcriptional regulator [Pedobacter sp. ISL-68]
MTGPKFDTSSLENHIKTYVSLSEDEILALNSLVQYRKVKKNQYLLHEGGVTAMSCYILSGCLRTYILDNKGIEHILGFSTPGWWTGNLQNFYNDKPSQLNIQAIVDTEIIFFTKETKEKLLLSGAVFEKYFRILTERSLIDFQVRTMEILSLSAEERYWNFYNKYPDLMLKLPQKYIAGYIGVTPEFLSKMKSSGLRKP